MRISVPMPLLRLAEIRLSRTRNPLSAITTPKISSLRSRDRPLEKEDGFGAGWDLDRVAGLPELCRMGVERVTRRELAGGELFRGIGLRAGGLGAGFPGPFDFWGVFFAGWRAIILLSAEIIAQMVSPL